MTVRPSPPPKTLFVKLPKDIALWLIGQFNRRMTKQDNSVATTVTDLRTDFNLLLTNLRAKGFMEE
jgi:hypothetical protein